MAGGARGRLPHRAEGGGAPGGLLGLQRGTGEPGEPGEVVRGFFVFLVGVFWGVEN